MGPTSIAVRAGLIVLMLLGLFIPLTVSGQVTVSGYTTLASALTACPAAGCTVWLPDGINPSLSSVLTVSNPVHLILGKNTITCTMTDPGALSGCIVIASENVEIEGQGPTTVVTQANAANIQNGIFLGQRGNIKIHGLKFDWNDTNQTVTGGFYTCIRSQAGSHDIYIYNNEFTRGGDRAIDLRGTNRSWIQDNYFYQTGLNVAGVLNRGGNSVSVDVDGTTASTDCWLTRNQVEEMGDAFACAHAMRAHIVSNTIRGRADFGNTPMNVEAGIDASGDTDVEIIGNHLRNVHGPNLRLSTDTISTVTYSSVNARVEGNVFYATAASLGSSDPRVDVLNNSIAAQMFNVAVVNNSFYGVRITLAGIDGIVVKGNSFHNILSTLGGIAIDLQQQTGATTKNFTISGNTVSTDNATLTLFLNLGGGMTAPDSCVITDNSTSTGVTNDVTANAGFATSTCYITRSNRTIGAYSNATSNITIRNATFPDPIPRLKFGGTLLVATDFSVTGWGSGAAVTPNNNATDAAGSVTVTSGTAPGANPTVTLTFHDGTWGALSPQCIPVRADLTADSAQWRRSGIGTTSVTFMYMGTPAASTNYSVEWVCVGH